MSEIPMPEPGGYEPVEPEKKRGCCGRTVLCIVVVAIVVVGLVALTVLLGPGPSNGETTTTTTTTTTSGPEYGERIIDSYTNEDPEVYPQYYRSEFDVYSSETQTSTQPDILFQINLDIGSDYVTTHIAVYDTDQATFDATETWAEAEAYLVAEDDISGNVNHYINLNNYADTYVWVLWFEVSGEKTSTWDIDITLTLRYNWNT